MDQRIPGEQTYNPWSIVRLVFDHLAAEGLRPVLGESGDPGVPAAGLLRALGITPDKEGSRQACEQTRRQLAQIRAAFEQGQQTTVEQDATVSHVESP